MTEQTSQTPSSTPPTPRPVAPTPAVLARLHPRPTPAPGGAPAKYSDSARFGRVDDEGRVFVIDEGAEHEVGSFPGGSPSEALQYFSRRYDELAGSVELLQARLVNPDVPAKEIADGLRAVQTTLADAKVVGDLPALRRQVEAVDAGLADRRAAEATARIQAKEAAYAQRETLVARAEQLAAQPPGSTQWKQSSEAMRALLEEWKQHQRTGPRLDKPQESELWQRFSQARNTFDKARRTFFAELDSTHASARAAKENLVIEAEALAQSRDWTPTARAFKQLMDRWRATGRANRRDDDELWTRFKAAQDAFFAAKDEVSRAEDESFRANLVVKERLLVEAEALLPVTDLTATRASLRAIQERWDKAGKVPRADVERTEGALRRVETAVREAEDRRWNASSPEVTARANSMASQLQASLSGLRDDLAAAQAAGDEDRVADLRSRIDAQQAWLDQTRAVTDH